jgi:ribonuclease-3
MKLQRLSAALGHEFANPDLLGRAMTHRSFGIAHNERLEFLGDAILSAVISATLYERFADLKEGDLSRQRANLVRQESLAQLAQNLNIGDYLRLGEGELKSGGFRRPSTLADALEAIFGAVYMDAGFGPARDVILRLFNPLLDELNPCAAAKDPKTALQEILQGRRMALPRYSLIETRGKAHAQEFEVECIIPELSIRSTGSGNSRRVAEQVAAQIALTRLHS